jgi:hypothetical protein
MDEADRMIDMGFEEDVRTIFSFFKVCNACENSHLLECDTVTVQIVHKVLKALWSTLLDPRGKGTMIYQNIRNWAPNDVACNTAVSTSHLTL